MKITIENLDISLTSYNTIIENQFKFRTTSKFIGENLVILGNVIKPTWWNRPLKTEVDQIVKLESDGLYSLNLPMLSENLKWKTNYNILVNEWSIPVLIQLKFKDIIAENTKLKLNELLYNAMYKTLIELGISKSSIATINNDILLNRKKIAGTESYVSNNIYCSSMIFTLKYNIEKEIFDRLKYGKAKSKWGITGVLDEFEINCTKQECIQLFRDNLEYYLNEIIKEAPLDE